MPVTKRLLRAKSPIELIPHVPLIRAARLNTAASIGYSALTLLLHYLVEHFPISCLIGLWLESQFLLLFLL